MRGVQAAEAEHTRRADQRRRTGSRAEGDPARLYAAAAGAGLVLLGVIGFFYEPSFATGEDRSVGEVFGLFAANGWQNLLHVAVGLLGLAAAGSSARTYALAAGLAWVLLALWGFLVGSGGAILGLFAVNGALNVLHLLLGLAGLAAGAASEPAPSRQRPAARRERRAPRRPARAAGRRAGER
jgi:hypothetical protein